MQDIVGKFRHIFLTAIVVMSVFTMAPMVQADGHDYEVSVDGIPDTIPSDDYFEFETQITNTGNTTQEELVTAEFNNRTRYYRYVEVAPGETENITMYISTWRYDEGNYNLTVETQDDSVTRQVFVENLDTATINGTVFGEDGQPETGNFSYIYLSGDSNEYGPVNIQTGNFSVDVRPGEYQMTAFGYSENDSLVAEQSRTINISDNETLTGQDINLTSPEVLNVSMTSPAVNDSLVDADAFLWGEYLVVRTHRTDSSQTNFEEYYNLTSLNNVTEETEFQITIETEDYEMDSIWWGVDDLQWNKTDTGPNTQKSVITGSAVDMQITFGNRTAGGDGSKTVPFGPMWDKSPAEVEWPSIENDTADVGLTGTMQFAMIDHDKSLFTGGLSENLTGLAVTTNAQTFTRPTYQNDTLRVFVAAPHKDVDNETHTGFYRAFIPNSQLDVWNITNASEDLNARWKGQNQTFSVNETQDGVWVVMENITYSSGYVEIQPMYAAGDNTNQEDDQQLTGDTSSQSFSTWVTAGALGLAVIVLTGYYIYREQDVEYV